MRLLLGGLGLIPTLLGAQIRAASPVVATRTPISLSWRRFDIDLTGPARPHGFVSAIGRRAALIGTETGSFEAWAWPLKLLHSFELAFKTPLYDQPIPARDIARRVEISPAGATIVYSHAAFTVTERVFAPLDEPALVVVLEVDAVRPIEVIARFRPDLQLAWPAGFGGRYVFWDDEERAFVLSESRRQVSAFFATYQGRRQPNLGKIPHEISHGAARIDWFDDYPYAFYHGDTTPFWMLAVAEYWRASGDTATIRRLWPTLKRAYDWAKATDADGDGLMDNARAGAGAIEVGDLQLGLQSDVYMSAVWVKAERRYAFALLEGAKLSNEVTVWPATGLAFGLFDEERGQQTAASLAGAGITTDWGARTLSPASSLFDPLHYNNGTVWPFVTGFDALGLYRYHNATMGLAATTAVARTTFLWGLGANPEVLSGASFEPLETAVPRQFFATSMLLTPLVRGLVGWEGDAPNDRVTLAPHFPAIWDSLTIERLPVGSGRYTVRFARTDTSFVSAIERTAGAGVDTLVFGPALPLGAVVRDVRVNGRPTECGSRATGADVHVDCRLPLSDKLSIAVHHTHGWEVVLPPPQPARGERSSGLKLVSQRLAGDTLVLAVEGLAGRAYRLVIRTPRGERTVAVALPDSGDAMDGYSARIVRVTVQP